MVDGQIRFAAATDVGKTRDHNEDNFLVDRKIGLFAVADGMGGHAAGEVASAIAVRVLHEELKRERETIAAFADGARTAADVLQVLEHAVQSASARIHEEAQADEGKRGMGTTLSAILVAGGRGFVAHVGDSRIYLLRGGEVQQVTEDHTVHNELLRRGRLDAEQIAKLAPKNGITRAVGVYERVEVDAFDIDVLAGDQVLLASDGLHNYVERKEDLAPFFTDPDDDRVTRSLIDFANASGGKDNITVVVVRVGDASADDSVALARKFAQKRHVLARTQLFTRLTERELWRVLQVAHVRTYAAGADIVREGERGEELFIVLSGEVVVYRGDSVLRTFGTGAHFGEMSLVRSTPRSASVQARGEAELIVIKRLDFFEVLRREPELGVKMLWELLGELAERLEQTSDDLRIARETLFADELATAVLVDSD